MQTQTMQSGDGIFERVAPDGIHKIAKRTTPTNGQAGYAVGCQWTNLAGAAGTIFYINIGTITSSSWLAIA